MKRRDFFKRLAATPVLPILWKQLAKPAQASATLASSSARRVHPSDSSWPNAESWEKLRQDVGGNLVKVEPPLAACESAPDSASCQEVIKNLRNPYFIGDQAGGTQTSGWVDAWTPAPSVYAVAVRKAADVVAAVNFARENNFHDTFVAQGCAGSQAPQPAVTVEAGAMWIDAYNAVTTKAGRYVQGSGCATVGVAGLIQSGGFGSFSKKYGMAATGLLEAEVVTADGALRTVNAGTNPDLFWAIKGGGGGSLGVVTKVILRTHELPDFFGVVLANVKATSDAAFRRLIDRFISFYKDSLFNPDWGETVAFRPDNTLAISMVFQGFDKQQAERIWQPFFDWVKGSPAALTIESAPTIASLPARSFWNTEDLRKKAPGMIFTDDRPGAADTHMW